tara:strand:+ start:223 stop:525 length:303 start_codon:yes stop_codon:yes gene_type:complete
MLTTSSRLKIQEILSRLAIGDQVSLEERIYINKYAEKNQNVSSWLRKATHMQRGKDISDPIDKLLNGLDICSDETHSAYDPDQNDLGEWFSGSPDWIRRS